MAELAPTDSLFRRSKPVVAAIHAGASPGVAGFTGIRGAVDRAAAEAQTLVALGVDGLLVENTHDLPGLPDGDLGPEVTAYLTRVASAVKRYAGRLPVGVRVFEGADQTALAVALAAGCDFVWAEGWAADPARAGRFKRYARLIGAEHVPVWTSIRPRSADEAVALVEAAQQAGPDLLVVLGPRPGTPPAEGAVAAAEGVAPWPLFCGGALDACAIEALAGSADGFVVGSRTREAGQWRAPVCERSVGAIVGAVEYARGQEVRQ